ncbi:MAG: GNAT family N-acetyltransferase [Micrococcales bacterium]
MVDLRFESLSVDNLHDFLDYFEHQAFNGSNQQWDGCYCQFYLNTPAQQEIVRVNPQTRHEVNRSTACSRIESGQMQGYLAYDGTEVVGWLLAGESKLFPGIPDADEKLARMLCFVIHPTRRGEGVATAVLNNAVDDLRSRGFAAIEAAPYRDVPSFEGNYRGTVSMYSKAGFEHVADLGDFGLLMRLEL